MGCFRRARLPPCRKGSVIPLQKKMPRPLGRGVYHEYSKKIDQKYKNEISKQLLECFSKKCRINKGILKIKITIKPKMIEFTLNRKVTEHDLQKFSLPPMKLMIRKPVSVTFDFY